MYSPCSRSNLQIDEGIDPLIALKPMPSSSRCFNDPIDEGREPDTLGELMFKVLNWSSLPIDEGMVPLAELGIYK
jgi:hypothetical protein